MNESRTVLLKNFSEALAQYAQGKVIDIVQNQHLGRVVYAGGDVMALLPVRDALSDVLISSEDDDENVAKEKRDCSKKEYKNTLYCRMQQIYKSELSNHAEDLIKQFRLIFGS